MHILFIVEAGKNCGLGHLMRCRSLLLEFASRQVAADLWVRGDRSSLGERSWPGDMGLFISGDDVSVEMTLRDVSGKMEETSYDWVVLDGYGFLGGYACDTIRQKGVKLLTIDDIAKYPIRTDILLNQNTERQEIYSPDKVQARMFLLGPKYALINPESRSVIWDINEHKTLKRVLISFGGTDRKRLTQTILEYLSDYKPSLDLDVIIGPYFQNGYPRKDYRGHHRLHFHHRVSSLAPFIRQSDFMISASGFTVLESCCIGVPSLVIQTVDNQREIVNTVKEAGAALCISTDSTTHGKNMELERDHFLFLFHGAAAPEIREKLSSRAKDLVDGRGASRVAEILISPITS